MEDVVYRKFDVPYYAAVKPDFWTNGVGARQIKNFHVPVFEGISTSVEVTVYHTNNHVTVLVEAPPLLGNVRTTAYGTHGSLDALEVKILHALPGAEHQFHVAQE